MKSSAPRFLGPYNGAYEGEGGDTPDHDVRRHPSEEERSRSQPSQFMLDSLEAGRPEGEVPWSGQGASHDNQEDTSSTSQARAFDWGPLPLPESRSSGDGGKESDSNSNRWGHVGRLEEPALALEYGERTPGGTESGEEVGVSWNAGGDDSPDSRSHEREAGSPARHVEGRQLKASAMRYRHLRTLQQTEKSGDDYRHYSGAGVGTDLDIRASVREEPDAAQIPVEVLPLSSRSALEEAKAILEEGHASDEDLLRPEGEWEWEDEAEATRRTFASGVRDTGREFLSAWGIPPLQPTEEDLKKQRMYERVHRMKFRKRNAANDFGDPDTIEDLMLDIDIDKDKQALPPVVDAEGEVVKSPGTGITRGGTGERNAAAGGNGKRGDGNKLDVDGLDYVMEEGSAVKAPMIQELGYLTPFTGNYLNLVLGEERMAAAATAASVAHNAEAAAARVKRDAAPVHLHRFMKPQELELPAGSQVVKVSGGKEHAMVLLKTSEHLERILPQHLENEGRVLMMGAGDHGQLGLGDTKLQTIPVMLSTLTTKNSRDSGGGRVRVGGERIGGHGSGVRRVIDVAAGSKHSVVVSEEREVAAFGTDTRGSTGQGETGEGKMHRLPRWMYWITTDTTRMVACAAGEGHTVLLSASWHVFTTGDGSRGKLGHGNERSQLTPRRVEALMGLKVASVTAGLNHTLLITETGLLYGCGANSHGQLGTGDRVDQLLPVRMRHLDFIGGMAQVDDEPERRTIELQERILGPLPGHRGQFLSASEENRSFAQPTEQQLAAAVKVREEVLGIRQQPSDDEIRLTMGLPESRKRGSRVVQACGGRAHTIILTDVGRVYVCGQSNRGQLGQGNKKSLRTVTVVSSMVNLSCVQIAAGEDHSVMLTTLGHVYICGNNSTGQLGDGTLEDSLVPKCLQPIIQKEDLLTKSKYQLQELEEHPMFGVLVEQVFASGASTFAVATRGERLFVCGSGAYGHPHERNPTGFADMLRLKLDEREHKKTMVMVSTMRMLRPDEQGFQDLVRQMVLYSLYNETVLAHIMKAMLDEVMRHPSFVVLYASLLERCMKMCLDCTIFAFRRVILLAIEDMGVKLLQAQDEALHRRLLQRMGWARYQQQQREAGGAGARQMTYFGMITDKESYNDFKRFREDCKSLQGFVRELFEVHGILLEDDITDLRAGFPGSQHSIGIIDSEQAQKKMTFFRSLVRWKSRGELAAEEAMRAAGLQSAAACGGASGTSQGMGAGAGGGKKGSAGASVVRQQGLIPNKPLPIRASEEAAWEFSEATGWEAYKLPKDIKPEEGSGWGVYLERQRREAKFRSPVIIPAEFIDTQAAAAEEESLDELEQARLKQRRDEEHRKRVGLSGKRIVESTLAPSFHRDNTVATAVRTEIETNMARRLAMKLGRHPLSGGSVLGGGNIALSPLLDSNTNKLEQIGTEDLATRKLKLQQKLASMAAAGESVREIEEYKHNAETNPSFGYCTQEEVDSAPPEVQAERARLAFRYSKPRPEGGINAD